jgi:hypothetical protein
MKEASLVKDYLPEPPIPTNKALLLSVLIILETRIRCLRASSKRTSSNFLEGFSRLYLSYKNSILFLSLSIFEIPSYIYGANYSISPSSLTTSNLRKSQKKISLSGFKCSIISPSCYENASNEISLI